MRPGGRRQAIDGEVAALFDRVYAPLVRSLRAAGYVDPEDAVQDAFIQASLRWRRIRTYDDPAAWIRRSAVRRCFNAQRSRRRQEALAQRLAAQQPQVTIETELDASIVRAVGALSTQQRTAIALFYLTDLSVAQVADAMGLSEGAVKYHLHAAREALRPSLESMR